MRRQGNWPVQSQRTKGKRKKENEAPKDRKVRGNVNIAPLVKIYDGTAGAVGKHDSASKLYEGR